MPGKQLQLAVIGCGAIFENHHLPALKRCGEWKIAFLVDNNEQRMKKYAQKLGCGYATDVSALPADIDACLVATPNYLHAQQSITLIKKGYHVICEKPMALDVAEAEEVGREALARGVQFFVVHQKRYLKNIAFFKKRFLPTINVKSIEISLGAKFKWESQTGFYESADKAGGGAMVDLGVHLLDLLVSIWGNVKIERSILAAPRDEFPVIDAAATCFGLVSECIPLCLRVSRTTLLNNSMRITTADQIFDISVNSNELTIKATDGSVKHHIHFVEDMDPFVSYWKSVHLALHEQAQETTPSNADDGIKVVQCLEMLKSSVEFVTI